MQQCPRVLLLSGVDEAYPGTGEAMGMTHNTVIRRSSDPFATSPLRVSSAIGYEIHEFLAWEALLLDGRRYVEWLGLLSQDLVYSFPDCPDHECSYNLTLSHLRKHSSVTRQGNAHTHRLLGNVIVTYGDSPEEFAVASYVSVNYSRFEDRDVKTLTVGRRDRLRRSCRARGFQITRRDVRLGWMSPEIRECLGPL